MNEIKSIVGKFAWGFLIVSIIWFLYALFNVDADDCSGIMACLQYHWLGAICTGIFSISLFTAVNTSD